MASSILSTKIAFEFSRDFSAIARRGKTADHNLTSGPGKLCVAFGIDKNLNNADLLGEEVWLEDFRTFSEAEIESGKRVGIDYAEEFAAKPWRFWVKNNLYVSRRIKGKTAK